MVVGSRTLAAEMVVSSSPEINFRSQSLYVHCLISACFYHFYSGSELICARDLRSRMTWIAEFSLPKTLVCSTMVTHPL
jgi:hypothetical protein